MKQLVILAGGAGMRLRERFGELPKAMIMIAGKPVVEHQIELAKSCGCFDIVILSNHRDRVMRDYVGDGKGWGVNILHQIEHSPLGTAGAVLSILPRLAETFIIMCGDLMADAALERLTEYHEKNNADVTLWVHFNDHPFDSDLVALDENGQVQALFTRPHLFAGGLACAGIYAVRKEALSCWGSHFVPLGLCDLLLALLFRGFHVFGYRSSEFVKDIGTPERYDQVCAEWEEWKHDHQSHSA